MPSNNDFELSVKYGFNADMGIRGFENILSYLSQKKYLNPELLHEYVITYNESCPNYKEYLGEIIAKVQESTEKVLPLICISENRITRPIIEEVIDSDQPHSQSNDQRRYQLESHSSSVTNISMGEQARRQPEAQRRREEAPSHLSNISMMVLGGFMAAAGIAAVAIAFTVLNVATLGVAGIVVGVVGAVSILSGAGLLGFFAKEAYKNRQEASDELLHSSVNVVPQQ